MLDENGEKIRLPSGRYKTRKVDLVDWNNRENAEVWRRAWADIANEYLAQNNRPERIDHRSYERQGIDQIPTVHVGVSATQMEKKGVATDKGEINRMIQKTNRIIREIRGYIDELREWLAEVFRTKKELQAAPRSPDIAMLLTKYLSVERERSRKYSVSWQQKHSAWHPLFVEALQRESHIEYLLDVLLYGTAEEKKALVAEQRKEVMRLEQRFAEHPDGHDRGRSQGKSGLDR